MCNLEVIEKFRDVDYCVRVPRQGSRLYHVNLLKDWKVHEDPGLYKIDWDKEGMSRSRELQAQVAACELTSAWQLHHIWQIPDTFFDVFSKAPGTVKRVEHHIPTIPGWVVQVSLPPSPLAI